ncbi:unnamed protein product [Urochloa humidicola]
MDGGDCPPWIDPGSAFRLVVKVASYAADVEYGLVEMAEQQHEIWFDRNNQYSLAQLHEDLAGKFIWGPSQTLSVWVVDESTGSEWKLRRDDYVEQMIKDRWVERQARLAVDVVRKDMSTNNGSSAGSKGDCASAVTNDGEGFGDTNSSPPHAEQALLELDWSTLVIQEDPNEDGLAKELVNEDHLYEALGFKLPEETEEEEEEQAFTEEMPIPDMSAEMEADMNEAAVNVDDTADEEPMYEWDRDNPDMNVGTCYPSMVELRLAVKQHAIAKEFEVQTEHSDKERYRVCCAAVGCPWKLRARTQHDGSVRIQINKGDHTCASTQRVISRMASINWVAERAIPLLKKKPSMGAAEIQKELKYKYNIDIKYQTVYNGAKRASEKLFGKWSDSFDWLYRFKAEIELRSPGSVVEIDTITDEDGNVRFSRFFCAFKASIDGFLNGCRLYLSIDSTALNGMWNGHMPAACALDGHNWMFPVAFGFFESETKLNWIWFMEQLRKAIGPMKHLAICTDACKGLESSVRQVFPQAEMRECFRHLMENLKKYYSGDVYGKNMWPAARAYSEHKFFFDKVLAASPELPKWLDEHHPFLWARSKFSDDIKCDYINNNLAECWNAWIKEHKDLPLHCMADAIREKLMILFGKRRAISNALRSKGMLPAIIHQLNAASTGLGHLKVTKGHPDEAEVTEFYKDEEVRRHVVYLHKRICTCRQWQITGKPCPHALTVIISMRKPDMGAYVDNYYSVAKFQAAYAGIIPSITDRTQWPEDDKGYKIHPPLQEKKREAGRLRKNRIKSAKETGGKATRQVRCPNCREYGHRASSWKCAHTGTKKRKRTKKKVAQVGRKKAKKNAAAEVQLTPRTRGALAREAAENARRAAAEAELKAAATREAALAATREEVEATRTEFAAREAASALEVYVPETSIQSTTKRTLFQDDNEPVKKMTPRRKLLATKIKKTPPKKGGSKGK